MSLIKKSVYIEKAPAKVNLFLNVMDKRTDGYHNLQTLFQAIDLCDYVTFEVSIETGDEDEVDFEVCIDSNNDTIKALGPTNIVAKTIEVFFSELPDSIINLLGKVLIEVYIDKHIPINAGLGGGSADAGAVLRILNTFFNQNFDLGLSETEILKIAQKIGADVPFSFLSPSKPRLYAESLGEDFKALDPEFPFDNFKRVIVVKPNIDIQTAKAYEMIDEAKEAIQQYSNGEISFYNSFEKVIFSEHPELASIKKGLKDIGCDYSLLTGSGSAILGFLHDDRDFDTVFAAAQEIFNGYQVIKSNFLNN